MSSTIYLYCLSLPSIHKKFKHKDIKRIALDLRSYISYSIFHTIRNAYRILLGQLFPTHCFPIDVACMFFRVSVCPAEQVSAPALKPYQPDLLVASLAAHLDCLLWFAIPYLRRRRLFLMWIRVVAGGCSGCQTERLSVWSGFCGGDDDVFEIMSVT